MYQGLDGSFIRPHASRESYFCNRNKHWVAAPSPGPIFNSHSNSSTRNICCRTIRSSFDDTVGLRQCSSTTFLTSSEDEHKSKLYISAPRRVFTARLHWQLLRQNERSLHHYPSRICCRYSKPTMLPNSRKIFG
jgi:hypothetical protein